MSDIYKVKLPNFEGPMDLLLFLIRKHKIDIYDIPIAFILSEYLKYLSLMEELDLGVEGSFLEIAATLMQIKIRMLLPSPLNEEEEIEDPRAELLKNLLEYKKIKEASEQLAKLAEDDQYYVYREIDKATKRELQKESTSYELGEFNADLYALIKVMGKYLPHISQPVPENIKLDKIKVEDKIKELKSILRRKTHITFSEIIKNNTKQEIIAFFLAILELARAKKITLFQNQQFGEIHIKKKIAKKRTEMKKK
jgi:segregation and condensation protein A